MAKAAKAAKVAKAVRMQVIDLLEELLPTSAKSEIVIMNRTEGKEPTRQVVKAILKDVEPGKIIVWTGEP